MVLGMIGVGIGVGAVSAILTVAAGGGLLAGIASYTGAGVLAVIVTIAVVAIRDIHDAWSDDASGDPSVSFHFGRQLHGRLRRVH